MIVLGFYAVIVVNFMIDNGKNNRQNSIIQQRSSDYERKKNLGRNDY